MRALVFDEGLKAVDMPIPKRGRGEALIRVSLVGICNTDIEVTRGYLAYKGIMGHEFVGRVEEADDADLIGKRVVGEINIVCGECQMCRGGNPRHCDNVKAMGINGWQGCFADYVVLPERNLHVVPDLVSDRQAVFTEPLAAGIEVLEQVHILPTDLVAVIGDGKLGLLTAQAIHASGHDVVVLGKHEKKLKIAESTGMDVSFVGEFTERVDVAVDCTGNASGIETAMAIVRPKGTIVLKSTFHKGIPVNLTPVVRNEITCVGSRCGPFPPALRLLEKETVSTEPLIDAIFSADQMTDAFEAACTRGSLKILMDFRA
ncbi:MAG TPA: alcohol dehydrogenase catalytic domain-containing protein [Bacillota bacterium]|nr:alcohol dehydrogenase catalytic domain-containing protein [Bacillota bacterium]